MKTHKTKTFFQTLLLGTAVATLAAPGCAQHDPPPLANEFKGQVKGKINWVHNSNNWFMLWAQDFQPAKGDAKKFDPLKKLENGLKIGVAWNGPGKPNTEMVDYLKSLKPGQQVTLDLVPGYNKKGVILAKVPSAKAATDKPKAQAVAKPEKLPAPGARISANDEAAIKHVLKVGPGQEYSGIGAAWQQALKHLNAGEAVKIQLAPGTHRDAIPYAPLSDQAADTLLVIEGVGAQKTIWSGSDQWDAAKWTDLGDGLYSAEWPHDWGNHSYAWETPRVIGHRSEMAFVDGQPLAQVLIEDYDYDRTGQLMDHANRKQKWDYKGLRDPKESLPPGSFGVAERKENGDKIYIRLPQGKKMGDAQIEVATRRSAARFDNGTYLGSGKNKLVLRGITFQHFAGNTAEWGALGTVSLGQKCRDVLIEDCHFVRNNSHGLNFGATYCTLRDNVFNYNGFSGLGGKFTHGIMENNVTNFNNWRGAWGGQRDWWLGGVKLHETTNHRVDGHQSIGNLASGFWYDVHDENVVVNDLVSVANDGHGLFLELSNGPFEINRLLAAGNSDYQFQMSIVGDFALRDSILYANRGGEVKLKKDKVARPVINWIWYQRNDEHSKRKPFRIEKFAFERNVIASGPKHPGMVVEHNGINRQNALYKPIANAYQGRDNVFYSEAGEMQFTHVNPGWQTVKTDFDGWKKWTREAAPQTIDPRFRDAQNYDFRLQEDSPLQARADELPTKKIDPALLKQADDFEKWVEWGAGLNDVAKEKQGG